VAALAVAVLRGVDVADAVQDAVMATSEMTAIDQDRRRKPGKSTLVCI